MINEQKRAQSNGSQGSLEIKYQDKMDQVVSAFESVFSLPVPIVIDTSLINIFTQNVISSRHTIEERALSAEYSGGLFAWYGEKEFENLAVPEEVRDELRFSASRFRQRSKDILSESRDGIRKHQKSNRGQCPHIRKIIEGTNKISSEIRKVSGLMNAFEQEYLSKYPLSRFASPEFNTALEKYPINRIHAAIREVCDMPGTIRNYSGERKAHPVNEGNDAKIFTRALSLTYEKPAVLFTCDSDFLRIQKEYRSTLFGLSRAYAFNVPSHPLYVAFMQQADCVVDIQTPRLGRMKVDELARLLNKPVN